METIKTANLTIEDAKKILSDLPINMTALSQGYSYLIEEAIATKKFDQTYQTTISAVYRKLAEKVCEFEIENYGEFKAMVDFSFLDNTLVFSDSKHVTTGVSVCEACSGLGEKIKFHKKPIKVQCLKCKSVSYVLNGEEIVIDGENILVNGENKSDVPKYKRLLGWVVKDCPNCDGTGRYITELEPDLKLNLKCIACEGNKYNPENEKTQVIVKCETCRGKRTVKIPVLAPSVNSTTLCRVCSGMGFIHPKRRPDNPVLTRSLASKIKNM